MYNGHIKKGGRGMKNYDAWLDKGNPTTEYEGLTGEEKETRTLGLRTDIEWLFYKGYDGEELIEEIESLREEYLSYGLSESQIKEVESEFR